MPLILSIALRRASIAALTLACGCASTPVPKPSPPQQPPPAPSSLQPAAKRFVAPAPVQEQTETWIGSYTGTVDVYLSEQDTWQRNSHIQLFIQADGEETLRILGHMNLMASRNSFYISNVAISPTGMLAGEQSEVNDLSSSKYAYSLTRSDDIVKGFVKMHQRTGDAGPFAPGDEWHFEVSRRALPDFR